MSGFQDLHQGTKQCCRCRIAASPCTEMKQIPKWVIFHVPHDSTQIPDEVRHQFVLDDAALAEELIKMTDHLTQELFTDQIPQAQVIRAPVSRLVVDVERFTDDQSEPMSGRGMGVVYMQNADRGPLRGPISSAVRRSLIDKYYRPHHESLTRATQHILGTFGRVLLVDAHSFASRALPYELDQGADRPEICIGTDSFHTPKALEAALVRAFTENHFTVKVNSPFAGALVPMSFYGKDRNVSAAMIEVRRDLYLDESSGKRNAGFSRIAHRLRESTVLALRYWAEAGNGREIELAKPEEVGS